MEQSIVGASNAALINPGLLRILLAGIVVVHHTSRLSFGTLAVFCFFILSGYWISKMWEEKYKRAKKPYIVFFVSRYWRIAPVLFVCIVLALIVNYSINSYEGISRYMNFEWILRSMFVVFSSSQNMVLPIKWSIDLEIQFYVLYPLIICPIFKLISSKKIGVLVILLSIFIFVFSLKYYTYPAQFILPYITLFLIGVFTYKFDIRFSTRWALLSIIAFSLISLSILYHPIYRYVILGGPNVVRSMHEFNEMFSFLGAILLFPAIANSVHGSGSHFDYRLGNLAYPLYLFHFIPVGILKTYAGSIPPLERIPYVAITYVAIMIGSLLIFEFDRRMDRYRKVYVAQRTSI